MFSQCNASSRGRGALARPRWSALALLVLVATASHAAAPTSEPTAAQAPAPAGIRLVAADAAAATAVFAIDDVLQPVKRGERIGATGLRLVHVGAASALIERTTADADRATRFQLAVGATLPALPSVNAPASVRVVVQSSSVQSTQGAYTDAPVQ